MFFAVVSWQSSQDFFCNGCIKRQLTTEKHTSNKLIVPPLIRPFELNSYPKTFSGASQFFKQPT